MPDRLWLLWWFCYTRWWPAPRSRPALLRRQRRRLQRFLSDLRLQPAFQSRSHRLEDWPIMDKAALRLAFQDHNMAGIRLEEAEAVALQAEALRDFRAELPGGLTVGLSSGTSGSRQVFLVSRQERLRWAGQMLARILSRNSVCRLLNPIAAPIRVAFFLRADSNLYGTLSSRRLILDHYDLTLPFAQLRADLMARPPQILVAPATVLAALAHDPPPTLHPWQVVSVAETLDDRDQAHLEQAFGLPVAQVYQAAEGCLGSTCPAGHIHLHENDLHIEPEWLDGERFHPVITDFSRRTQWFIRYRLEDVLRVNPEPCPCGAPTLRLKGVEGRKDEVLWLPHADGRLAPLFPDAIRQAVYSLPDAPTHYRILQRAHLWEVQADTLPRAEAVGISLRNLAIRHGLQPPEVHTHLWTPDPPGAKTRRIRCLEPCTGGAP